MAEPAGRPAITGDSSDAESGQGNTDDATSARRMNTAAMLARVQVATTGDLKQETAELQKRNGLLQAEVNDARKSLEYMNQLLVALKAHKKATAAAKAALEQLQQQLEERDQEISDLKTEKSRLQEANKNLESELEEAEMSTMHTVAAAEEARKLHVTAVQQLEKQLELEAEQFAQEHEQVIMQLHLELHDAAAREGQRLVTIMVMGAIDKAKTEEATQLQAHIAQLQAEGDRVSRDCVSKDQAIEQLESCIVKKDARIEELQGSLSTDDSEIQRLKGIIQERECEKEMVQADLAAAQVFNRELEQSKHELVDSHTADLKAVEQETALLHSRIADLESVNDDLNVTITSKAEDVLGKERVLAELRGELQGMSSLVTTVETELRTYQLERRREHLETVLEDLNASPGIVIDLQGAVVTCSLQHAAGVDKLELFSAGSILKNGTLRLPYGCTLCVQPANGMQLVDITLQMMDAARAGDTDRQIEIAEAGLRSALLRLEPGAGLTITRCRVSGCCGVGVSIAEGAKLCGEDLWLEHCNAHAMEVLGGHVDLVGFSLKASGGGLVCSGHARVALEHLSAHGVKGLLVRATDGAELQLHKSELEGGDVAIFAEGLARLHCQEVTFLGGFASAGVRLAGSGTTAKLEACTLRKHDRAALYVSDGGELSLLRCTVSEYGCNGAATDGAALQVHGVGSKAIVHSCDFRWNHIDSICCYSGGLVEIMGSKLTRNDGCCVLASGADSKVVMTDMTISHGNGTAMKARHSAVLEASAVNVVHCSAGAEAKSRASIICTNSRFEGCSLRGCGTFGGAQVSLTDVEIVSSASRALHTHGAGSLLRCVNCKLLRSAGTQALCELGASLMLEGVQIAEGTGDGIVVAGPETSAVVSACAVAKQQGTGVRVKSGQLALSGGSITACGSVAVVEEAGSVQLSDVSMADCGGGMAGRCGAQITAKSSKFANITGTAALALHSEGTHAHVEACCMRSCTHGGVLAGPGASCELIECAFEHNGAPCTQSRGPQAAVDLDQCTFEGTSGPCISVEDGGSSSARHCRMHRTEGGAVCIDGLNSTGKLQGCELKDTGNHALIAQGGGSCVLDSCAIEGSRTGAGLVALGEGSQITCTGGHTTEMQQAAVVVRDAATIYCKTVQLQRTLCGSGCIVTAGGQLIAGDCSLEGNSDHGIMVAEGGRAQLQACRLAHNRMGCGVFVADSGSHFTAKDCKLEENGNCGALVTGGGLLTLHRCEVVEHMCGAGAVVQGHGSRVDLRESTVVGCEAVGLMAFDGGRADCKRVTVSHVTAHGVEARGVGTEVSLEDCCLEKNTGYGVLARSRAVVHLLQGCMVADNGHAGQTQTDVEGDDAPGELIIHPNAKISGGSFKGRGR